jgi:hypothetical protein
MVPPNYKRTGVIDLEQKCGKQAEKEKRAIILWRV